MAVGERVIAARPRRLPVGRRPRRRGRTRPDRVARASPPTTASPCTSRSTRPTRSQPAAGATSPGARPTVVLVARLRLVDAVLGAPAPGADPRRLPGRQLGPARPRPVGPAGPRELHRRAQLGRDLAAVIDATCTERAGRARRALDGRHDVMSLAGQHPDLVRDRVLAVALVATSPGGAELTEFGLGATRRAASSARSGRGVLSRLSRHAGPSARCADGPRRAGRRRAAVVLRLAGERRARAARRRHDLLDLRSTSWRRSCPTSTASTSAPTSLRSSASRPSSSTARGDLLTPPVAQRGDRRAASPGPSTSSSRTPGTSSCSSTRSSSPSSSSCSSRRAQRAVAEGVAGQQQAAGAPHRAGHRQEAPRWPGPGPAASGRGGRVVSGRRVVLPRRRRHPGARPGPRLAAARR